MAEPAHVVHDCALSAERYWSLRDDHGWIRYVSTHAEPPSNAEILEESEDDDGNITRVTQLTTIKNPIPWTLRGALGCRDGFRFTISEKWNRHSFDREHKMTFVTKPPVMADKIAVIGAQWVEPMEEGVAGCRLHFELSVECSVKGIGSVLGKGIADGSLNSYKQAARRALEYVTLREASERVSRMSHNGSFVEPATPTAVSRAASALPDEPLPPDTPTADGVDGVPPPPFPDSSSAADMLRVRVRMRWRMALMGVRFQRAFQMQQDDQYRLCDAKVDEPRSEGFGPKKHTTYRIASRVRNKDEQLLPAESIAGGWLATRHRFSDFLPLRAQLHAFLPGLTLPPLPEKKVPNRFAKDVIEGRRAILQAFLQHVLDHPILATCDELAEFLGWPEEARAPVFARAQTCYDTPASATRRDMEKLWSLRQRRRSTSTDAQPPAAATNGFHAPSGQPGLTSLPSFRSDAGGDGGEYTPPDVTEEDDHASPLPASAELQQRQPLLRRGSSTTDAGGGLHRNASVSSYDTATSSRNISRLNSAVSGAGGGGSANPLAAGEDDDANDYFYGAGAVHASPAVPSHGAFSDALAAAMLRTANEAASTVQRIQRAHSARNSRLTEEDDDDDVQPAPPTAASSSSRASTGAGRRGSASRAPGAAAAATSRADEIASLSAAAAAAARQIAAAEGASTSAGAAGASSSDVEAQVSLLVLSKLEAIEARLRTIEGQHRRRSFMESLFCAGNKGCG